MGRVIGSEVVLESNEGYESYMSQRRALMEALIDKWQWLLEGTKKQQLPPIDRKHWGPLAMLFENQMMATRRDKWELVEATVKADVALPVTYSLPIIRKVYPKFGSGITQGSTHFDPWVDAMWAAYRDKLPGEKK